MQANSSLIPSARDLILVFPRLAHRAGSFAFSQLPEQVDSVLHKIWHGGSAIADATATNVTTTATITKSGTGAVLQRTAAAAMTSAAAAQGGPSPEQGLFTWFSTTLHFEGVRGFGSMFSYFSSRWALATFTVSIFLNRTHFYASSRHSLRLRWKSRLFIYLVPIILLSIQALWVLQAIRCQTSPEYSLYRYGDQNKNPSINFGGEGGFLYWLSSHLLFWQEDSSSCAAMNMSIKDADKLNIQGSFALVWPFFITICISQFIETLACALQGRQPMAETGMTTFEHSLAFAECEAMISNALGLGAFGGSKHERSAEATSVPSSDTVLLSRSMILRRLNVPSEVLLISFISCLSHLSSSMLAVAGKRNKYRLVNTGVWAMCYLGAFVWSFHRLMQNPLEDHNDLGILRFPTVCIVGFIPHMLIICGIAICACIYGLAILVTVISPPPEAPGNLTIGQRFAAAFNNMQANVQFFSSSPIKLNWQEDFYSNLLKIGFNILTAASEAVYLNEGSGINIHDMTWVERKRLRELGKLYKSRQSRIPIEVKGGGIAPGLEFLDERSANVVSGYANERKSRARSKDDGSTGGGPDGGIGLSARRNRWELVVYYLTGVGRVWARLMALLLMKLGFHGRPAWLFRYANVRRRAKIGGRQSFRDYRSDATSFWVAGQDGRLMRPQNFDVDVEAESRQRMSAELADVSEQLLDERLYAWWAIDGWWGDVDTSGDYTPSHAVDDEDVTSIITESTATGDFSDWESDDDDGRRTPTRADPFPVTINEPAGAADLARLLDPRTPEDRQEAQLLAQHLQSPTPLTRSAYRRRFVSQRSQVLLPPSSPQMSGAQAEADEELTLEHFILSRRQEIAAREKQQGRSWASGADGLGAGGPVCVVCQSAPRAVLVWPCGCLSICDDCRVGVAARNFNTCLCCRTGVVAYSRLYVP
ncbi:hypothetical protein ANO11243_082290 [Dothideomycetidae sp. 11243]|nr:hypothetical protein ANO11243_082290 [fungal sp. No.11243]